MSCSPELTPDERMELGSAYGEILIIKNLYPGDSVAQEEAYQRYFDTTQFESADEVLREIEELVVSNPDELRHVLDSTDSYLTRMTGEPTTVTP